VTPVLALVPEGVTCPFCRSAEPYCLTASGEAADRHHAARKRAAESTTRVGDWWQPNRWTSITEIQRADGSLTFDPPNVVFVEGGQRLRVVDPDSDSPVLEVQRFNRKVDSYRLRLVPSPGASS
jgi:hypothetical protein